MGRRRSAFRLPDGETVTEWPTPEAKASPNAHFSDKRDFWVETRYSAGRGWFAILWPWPEPGWAEAMRAAQGYPTAPLHQEPGETLPVVCKTRQEAADWAWTLAEMCGHPENRGLRFVTKARAG